jgi:hypothetical protein
VEEFEAILVGLHLSNFQETNIYDIFIQWRHSELKSLSNFFSSVKMIFEGRLTSRRRSNVGGSDLNFSSIACQACTSDFRGKKTH